MARELFVYRNTSSIQQDTYLDSLHSHNAPSYFIRHIVIPGITIMLLNYIRVFVSAIVFQL